MSTLATPHAAAQLAAGTHEVVLEGCRPEPLAHYLKALGVLRLVAEQVDPQARACWQGDRFVLRSKLDADGLRDFFLTHYAPTPIIAPWNGGSGFYGKDRTTAIEAMEASEAPRFLCYARAIHIARGVLVELEVGDSRPDAGEAKTRVLTRCRAVLPDEVVDWLDTAFVITGGEPKYPPLLGTGGNDGRLEFTNNLMQRLADLFDLATGESLPGADTLLDSALFDNVPAVAGAKNPIGQFLPGAAGGANAAAGFDGDASINAWDYVLMLEGALLFSAAVVRRMGVEDAGVLAYPFTVRASGVGYGSASAADEASSRGEIWLPLWREPASLASLRALFGEGRARVGKRTARNGVDFVRAVANLGVDRGIDAFSRVGFQVRNGLAYFATPLGRIDVELRQGAELLDEVDGWLDRHLGRLLDGQAPASVRAPARMLERAIFELCRHGGAPRLLDVFIALGRLQGALAGSLRWATDNYVRPLPLLSPRWIVQAYDGSPELRLAAALASVTGQHPGRGEQRARYPLRQNLEPVIAAGRRDDVTSWARWAPELADEAVWSDGDPVAALNAIVARRLICATQRGADHYDDHGRVYARLPDVAAFIDGHLDTHRLAALLRACVLVDWYTWPHDRRAREKGWPWRGNTPGAVYGLIKLCFAAGPERRQHQADATSQAGGDAPAPDAPPVAEEDARSEAWSLDVRMQPAIHRLAAAGRGPAATRLAARRLRGSGHPPAVEVVHADDAVVRRAAAMVLAPLHPSDLRWLAGGVLREAMARDEGDAPAPERTLDFEGEPAQ